LLLQLIDEHDTPWIAALIDELESAVGHPWRQLLERIERLPLRVSAARRAAVVQALRHSLGGREAGSLKAANVRRHVLGRAALDQLSRTDRISAAATALEVTPEQVEQSIWSDLPGERLVLMPRGRPAELAVAATANLAIIQRTLLRCHQLRLQLTGNARSVVRTAAVRGLLATARRRGEAVELDISGPLALFHRTTVYGRALGSLVPHLAWCERFLLDACCDLGRGAASLRLQPPILLPPSRAPKRFDSRIEARFARDMAKHAPAWRVLREPSAIDAGTHLAFPDFMLEHREQPELRWWVEIVGFWTSEYLAQKLATYRAARLSQVILCIDAKRTVDDSSLPIDARIIRFDKHVPVGEVVEIIEGSLHPSSVLLGQRDAQSGGARGASPESLPRTENRSAR
jgi:predicted nuclease of restriction endonuclease-like RecB superfamily